MPPKIENIATLIAKRDIAIASLDELYEEFNMLYQVEPELIALENVYKEIAIRFRGVKKQQTTIAEKLVESGETESAEMNANKQIGDKVKSDYFKCSEKFIVYKKKCYAERKPSSDHEKLEAMTCAVTKMADVLSSQKNTNHGLEKLSVPNWDGSRKNYATWKCEFNYWMEKYKQDKDEQLQRLRKALPRNSFWANQVRPSQTIDQAWKILDTEFGDQRKLMDGLLKEITNLKPIKSDSTSLSRYAATILGFVNNMEQIGCEVTNAKEAPFVMSQLLSKLDPKDNIEFGREMHRIEKEENVLNLLDWLNSEASLRSRVRKDADYHNNSGEHRISRKFDNRAMDSETSDDDVCPLGCEAKHLLAACPKYQRSTIDQRWEIVKQNSRCRKCLRKHHTNVCKKPDGSTCDRCRRRHHRTLHNEQFVPANSSLNPQAAPYTNSMQGASNHSRQGTSNVPGHWAETQASTLNIQQARNVPGQCPVQKVKIKDKDGNLVETLAMLDSGSNTSFISKNVKKKLGLSGPKVHLTMNLAGGQKKSEESELVNITVVPISEETIQKPMQVYAIYKPYSSAKTVSRRIVNSYRHLEAISNDLYLSGGSIGLLIGTDFPDAFVDIHVIPGSPGEPIAKRNCFGWYVMGQFSGQGDESFAIRTVDVGTVSALEDMTKLLVQDTLGVKPTVFCTCKDNELKENKFIKSIADSTEIVDGRIQVRMPWSEDGPPKESNYDVAYQRMLSSEKTFKRKNCIEDVQVEIQKLEQEFIVEIKQVDHNVPEWYLPMQAVLTPDRSTKLRLVYDASAKGQNGKSLNDHLEKGPNYINSLPNVLIAWRFDQVAYSGDMRKMFNQVRIHPDDQVFHRFLWRTNESEQPRVYQWVRLNFGDKPAPDIAAAAIKTLAKASEAQHSEGAKELCTHVYVDDIGGSRENEARCKKVTSEIDAILSTGQFQVKAWHSNNKNVNQSDEERPDFLGHKWIKVLDKISFKKSEIGANLTNLSKRGCLASVAQMWDPMGLVVPCTIELRIDLQELWSAGYSWDEILPEEIRMKWIRNIQILNQLLTYEFDRKLKPDNAVGFPEIHGFCDGGEKAYGAVVFLRWKLANSNYFCVPLMVKAFVAPLKKKSIPRLELMGCLTLSRLYSTCKEALEFAELSDAKTVFWMDSQTVLAWIKTPPKRFKPFVSVRVAEIQETLDTQAFKYIRSDVNPADVLTRGVPPEGVKTWMEGPPFLQRPEEEWPTFKENSKSVDEESLKEIKSSKEKTTKWKEPTQCTVSLEESTNIRQPTDNPILQHLMKTCSTFTKARKTLAYVLRFINNARKKENNTSPTSPEELKESELQMFKWCQETININTVDQKLMSKPDEQGLIRAYGRLENIRSLPNEMRNPIILPKGHQMVDLLLKHLHAKRAHCGFKSLIYESRKRFWIVGVRKMAKQVTSKCVTCKKLRRKPMGQLMGQLPKLRVAAGFPAFSSTALDMFGPFQVKVGRKPLKEAHVIIFTCMTTRAIHLELVTDKSTDTFLMAFSRLASLRGHPINCWSDCGTNFVGAQQYLKEVMQGWDIPRIQSVLSNEFSYTFKCEWNVPRASHQNGVVESLIKSVRQALDATSKNQSFTEEQWRTHLAEVTYLVNSRPLYPSSDGIWESPPVSPNDLLIGHHFPPPAPEQEERVNPRHLMRSTEKRVQEFWRCWIKYFAPNLLPRNKWYRPRENLKEGVLVLEMEPTPRRTWKLGLVLLTYPGADGLVRKARIKTATSIYDRPIHKLCLIATKEELSNET